MAQIDAFTSQVFGGNPAAVIPLESWLPDELMQDIAEENNLSETAFYIPKDDHFHIRWFTPASEVDLCGHATLATAHYLIAHKNYAYPRIVFDSRSGLLEVEPLGKGYVMDFPSDHVIEVSNPSSLHHVVDKPIQQAFRGKDDYLIVLSDQQAIVSAKVNLDQIAKLDGRGLIITAQGEETDIVSRCFYPAFGIKEDPATGSAHTLLTPYWAKALGKNKLTAYQASARGAHLQCELKGDRTFLHGHAVTYSLGKIFINR